MVQVVTQEKLRHKEVRHLRKEHFIQQLEYLRQRGAWFGSVREIGGAGRCRDEGNVDAIHLRCATLERRAGTD